MKDKQARIQKTDFFLLSKSIQREEKLFASMMHWCITYKPVENIFAAQYTKKILS